MTRSRWLLIASIALAFLALAAFDPWRFFDLDYLKAQQATLQQYAARHPVAASAKCFVIYAAAAALSVPGAIVMTLAAGAVFGVVWGTLIVSFASTLGATLAFLMTRYLFRGYVQSRFGHHLGAINRGMRTDGPIYLLSLRLIPVVSFILVNLLMALTPISVRHFYLYSQLGMLPATMVYVNAGTRLAHVDGVGDILSAPLLISFALLAALPVIGKVLATTLARRRFGRE